MNRKTHSLLEGMVSASLKGPISPLCIVSSTISSCENTERNVIMARHGDRLYGTDPVCPIGIDAEPHITFVRSARNECM